MEKQDDGAQAMQILMFGWEFPPSISGGLGTACFGMTKALVDRGHRVTFVVPSLPGPDGPSHVALVAASDFSAGAENGPFSGDHRKPRRLAPEALYGGGGLRGFPQGEPP